MRTTIRDFQRMKAEGTPITMLTAYDVTSARLAEAAGVDSILVGDSLGMVIQGHDNPIPVTLDHVIYHAQIVTRVTQKPLVIGDMPFMTYSVSVEQALVNSARMMQEGGVGAVKMEGGEMLAPTIERIVSAGIPVVAHIGLLPQSVHKLGGLRRMQGKDVVSARQLLQDAAAVENAGAFAVVVEGVPAELGRLITQRVHIPTIGIAAGPDCDGQVQVFHDLLGLFEAFIPKHARRYAEGAALFKDAIAQYAEDVRLRRFPTAEHAVHMTPDVLSALFSEEQDD
jgi:3-methyl-2-oxobutanoate hydroxymethyltransferase